MHSRVLGAALALVLSCSPDGDGCNGGPDGPATKWCQKEIERMSPLSDAAMPLADICTSCCHQEVPYKGTIEDGKCVCR